MFNDRHKYILEGKTGKMVLKTDPMGWEDTETEIGRSEKTFGIFLTVSNNLEFSGEAKEFLEMEYAIYGPQAEVVLTKHVKHPQTDEWQLAFPPGKLDFTTRKIENNRLIIDFTEGGLRELLASQIREKFELDRRESIEGKPIALLNTSRLELEGRKMLLVSRFKESTTDFTLASGRWDSGEDFRPAYRPAPITAVANADPENLTDPSRYLEHHGGDRAAGTQSKFYLIADRDRGETKMKLDIKFTIAEINSDDVSNPYLAVVLRKFTDGENFVLSEEKVLLDVGNPFPHIGETFTINYEEDLEILEGESYDLVFMSNGNYGRGLGNTGYMDIVFSGFTCNLPWREDSYFSPTTSKFLTAFQVGERLTQIFTGKRKFISNLLTSDWKDLGFTCGGWIRNLVKVEEQEDGETTEKEWSMAFSFEDFYNSIHAVQPVGYGVVTKGAKQFIALEGLRFFFRPYKTIDLGEVDQVKRSTASEFIFSSITTGYQKGGNYEQPLGLDEYNTQSTWTTPITVLESKYEALGPSRTDSYGPELARRKQYKDYPDEDTSYDKDNFLIDCKQLNSAEGVRTTRGIHYKPRLWMDDFNTEPKGIYSPETAFNLRLTPLRNLLRHAFWYKGAIRMYDWLRYASNEGNKSLSVDGMKENDNIEIKTLDNPLFEPEWVEFEKPFSQEIMDQLLGTTIINGEEVNNFYGQVEYIANGVKERGYLFTAKTKDKHEFKVLKAYGF